MLGKIAVIAALTAVAVVATTHAQEKPTGQGFSFRTGVELINVTATVTDDTGRFASGLRQEDFRVYEDGELRPITHFTAERVPVSLGIVLDTSGSMSGEKMQAAKQALQRFLFELLGEEDEVFLYRFDNRPELVSPWTRNKDQVAAELRRLQPRGATTLYDAIAEAIPLASTGRNRKKALLIISDGNDSSSYTKIEELKRLIRESEVLVYAIGIDSMTQSQPTRPWFSRIQEQRRPTPFPFPMPGGRRPPPMTPPRYPPPSAPNPSPGGSGSSRGTGRDEAVNVRVLREITDTSGGRTEIIWQPGDLDGATAGIADELSKQYFLGYPAASHKKDGRWHMIRVEVQNPNYIVRARRGYVATP